ncbi:hypothetical protein EDC04DRAFT_2601071 [Pisolithus marmoratus]|nr:hypothetical protein EDC04DRAFT_2601071 [Pisolithus marmoratus]
MLSILDDHLKDGMESTKNSHSAEIGAARGVGGDHGDGVRMRNSWLGGYLWNRWFEVWVKDKSEVLMEFLVLQKDIMDIQAGVPGPVFPSHFWAMILVNMTPKGTYNLALGKHRQEMGSILGGWSGDVEAVGIQHLLMIGQKPGNNSVWGELEPDGICRGIPTRQTEEEDEVSMGVTPLGHLVDWNCQVWRLLGWESQVPTHLLKGTTFGQHLDTVNVLSKIPSPASGPSSCLGASASSSSSSSSVKDSDWDCMKGADLFMGGRWEGGDGGSKVGSGLMNTTRDRNVETKNKDHGEILMIAFGMNKLTCHDMVRQAELQHHREINQVWHATLS